ncbi:hypothetical protein CVT24_004861 [Panaeolus cyanescens]|uniref:WDR59/RTC1-like RING zinc finger domain-containing protein n=1 Tax=Panaeolus cyanescens TaxID=181874 RepID=A0A409V9V5_9AGAR|nr:hypothetical protein CVT24_004861 [Panaeolus cyanescens]
MPFTSYSNAEGSSAVLRIVRVSDPSHTGTSDHKSSVGKGGFRIDASRNLWEGSGLKIDSASTDVAWGHGVFNNKILTSARNGELILWDINKSGGVKYERRSKDHIRSIHQLSVSHIVHHYCVTGSADGHMRVWDLRDLSKSIMRVHHPISVRSLVFSPSPWQPLQAVVGLDNGSIYRHMGQRGQLDKIPVAHTAAVTALDWCSSGGVRNHGSTHPGIQGDQSSGLGWIVSGGLDKCVKVWDLTAPGSSTHIPSKPTYTLHPSYPVRRVEWRPEYECELAIVSSNEYAVASSDAPGLSNPNTSGLLTRVGSGLESFLKGSGTADTPLRDKAPTPTGVESKSSVALQCMGDAIEIWDVRRGWIAKWSVTGSAAEGGVTDIAFDDSHALFAQHNNGSFSQMDLRETTKPLDSIPRVAATWEPTGSMSFIAEQKSEWEVPYDDIAPDPKQSGDLRKASLKALGDVPARSSNQTVATFAYDLAIHDLETFTALARRYVFEGQSRQEICHHNAAVAFSTGHDAAAQVWLLLHACLKRYLPGYSPSPSLKKPKKIPSPLIPQGSPNTQTFHSFATKTPDSANFGHKTSPTRRQTDPVTLKTGSISRGRTPLSSAASSPRHPLSHLPPITPRRASFFSRRESVDAGVVGRSTLLRRPSISVNAAVHSASPNERSASSLRHVGEGVLDSDSSSEEDDDDGEEEEEDNETAGANSSDDEVLLPPLISPTLAGPRVIPAPSPLSRGHQAWTESEDDAENLEEEASSPSPQSTETESDNSSSGNKKARALRRPRRNSVRPYRQSRSRSSTLASLAAPHPPLMHQDSHTSIRTIIAESPIKENAHFTQEESLRNPYAATTSYQFPGTSVLQQAQSYNSHDMPSAGHRRQKSQTFSEFRLGRANSAPHGTSIMTFPTSQHEREALDAEYAPMHEEEEVEEPEKTLRRMDIIEEEEKRIAETTLEALREALEEFADEGDVQMCSMLALVAPEELKISKFRATRFLDAYLDLLNRLRLYTCAAYIRKYCHVDEIKKYTLVQTTIYTACGRCRKPLLTPATNQGPLLAGTTPSTPVLAPGAFAFCIACRSAVVNCAICRLPVRSLLFQCSVCHHGGHEACYERYYMETPMRDLSMTTARYLPSSNASSGDDIGVPSLANTGSGSMPGVNLRGRSSKGSEITSVGLPATDDDAMSMTSGISTQSYGRTFFPNAAGFDSPAGTSPVRSVPGTRPGRGRTGGDSGVYTRLAGHPCAAGCGHFCWAASAVSESRVEDL